MKPRMERLGREIDVQKAQRMCFDKKPYKSKNIARDSQSKRSKKYGPSSGSTYKCPICGMWHLTSLEKEESHMARKRVWE